MNEGADSFLGTKSCMRKTPLQFEIERKQVLSSNENNSNSWCPKHQNTWIFLFRMDLCVLLPIIDNGHRNQVTPPPKKEFDLRPTAFI